MGFAAFFSRQARRPSGLFGRFVMSVVFDRGNAFLNDLVLDAMAMQEGDRVLEVGCGTGRLIREMTKTIDRGYIEGVDFSDEMVAIAKRRNRGFIASGRVKITRGDFDELEYECGCFDKVCSVNTVYFWSRPESTAKRIADVLVPGGSIALAFEDIKQLRERNLSAEVFRLYTVEEVRELLANTGFSSEIDVLPRKQGKSLFHCVVAKTPRA